MPYDPDKQPKDGLETEDVEGHRTFRETGVSQENGDDDTEGHRRTFRIGDAGEEDDTEGHRRSFRIGDAGEEDDTEGHGRGFP